MTIALISLGASLGCSALFVLFMLCREKHLPPVRDDLEQRLDTYA